MPLQKLQFRPGVNREATTYANEGGWYESEKVRFRSGFPEKLGGWINLAALSSAGAASTFKGVARDMWNWVTLAFSNLNGVGTNQKYYIESGGQYNDITPTLSTGTLGANPFATTSGSKLVTVTSTAHGMSVGTWATFSGATAVGGSLTTATGSSSAYTITVASSANIVAGQGVSGTGIGSGATVVSVNTSTNVVTLSVANSGAVSGSITFTISISGSYEVITVIDGNSYTIVSTVSAPVSTSGGGSAVTYTYQIPAGGATYTTGNGWGAGTWGGRTSSSVFTTLSAGISSTDTTINVASTAGFSNGNIQIDAEIITCTVASGTSFSVSQRGVAPTTAASHSSGASVSQGATSWGAASTVGVGQQLRLWTSDNFGQDLILAPRDGSIYYWETPSSTSSFPAAVLLSSRSGASSVPLTTLGIIASDVQRFVIALGSNPYGGTTFDPMLVRWSDQESAVNWTPSTSNQAGEYRLAGGSTIVTGRTARQEILIWTDSALYTMQYLGPPYVWGFNLLMDNISIISPNAVASVNNVTYWMGVDKFYSYSGRVETLPCTLRQYVFNDINQEQAYQIVSGTNEGYNEVWWFYPSANSTVNDKYVIYNHLERIWYPGTINRTFWLDSPLRQYPMGAFSVQNSYLATAISTTTQTSLTLLNGYAYPTSGTVTIDSEDITYTAHDSNDGNTLVNCTRGANGTAAATHTQYAAVTYKTPNQVMFHEYGVDDGSLPTLQPIDAYIQSSDFDIGDGHNFGFVWRMLPDVTFDGSTAVAPQITITVRPRQNSGTRYGTADNPAVISDNNYALSRTYNVQLFTGQVYTRIRGRQMAFKVESTGLGTTWQLGTPRIDIRPDGRR
jgi:hypothetical protein